MRLGRQVHDGVGLVLGEHAIQFGAVADVDLFEGIAGMIRHRSQRFQVARVGQLVQVHDRIARVANDMAHQGRADESGSAGN